MPYLDSIKKADTTKKKKRLTISNALAGFGLLKVPKIKLSKTPYGSINENEIKQLKQFD